jgi:hypothetical protein
MAEVELLLELYLAAIVLAVHLEAVGMAARFCVVADIARSGDDVKRRRVAILDQRRAQLAQRPKKRPPQLQGIRERNPRNTQLKALSDSLHAQVEIVFLRSFPKG